MTHDKMRTNVNAHTEQAKPEQVQQAQPSQARAAAQPGQRAAKPAAWSRVLQASNVRSRRKLTCELLAAPKLL